MTEYTHSWVKAIFFIIPLLINIFATSIDGTANIIGLLIFLVSEIVLFLYYSSGEIIRKKVVLFCVFILLEIIIITVHTFNGVKNLDDFLYYQLNKYVGIFLLFIPLTSKRLSFSILIKAVWIFYLVLNISLFIDLLLHGFLRGHSLFGSSYNAIASFNLVGFPVLFYASKLKNDFGISKLKLIICQVLMYLMTILSGSRIALPLLALVLLFELIIVFRKTKRKSRLLLIFFILIPVAIFVLSSDNIFGSSFQRFRNSIENIGSDIRVIQYETTFNIIKNHSLLFGTGSPKADYYVLGHTYAHNGILETMLESGLFGLVLLFSYHYGILKQFLCKKNQKQINELNALTFIVMFGMSMFHPILTSSLAFNYLYVLGLITIFYGEKNQQTVSLQQQITMKDSDTGEKNLC